MSHVSTGVHASPNERATPLTTNNPISNRRFDSVPSHLLHFEVFQTERSLSKSYLIGLCESGSPEPNFLSGLDVAGYEAAFWDIDAPL